MWDRSTNSASSLSPISFLNFPQLSLFPVPLSSLSASLSLSPLSFSLLACHGITSYRSPAACHLHQTAGASSSGRQPLRAHVSVSTLARVHTHIRMHTQTRHVSASGRHTDGYGCHGSSAVLHSPSSLRSPLAPYSRLRHALRLIHSFSPSLSRQPAISFQGCRWWDGEEERGRREREASNHTNWGIVSLTPCIRGVLSITDFLSAISFCGKFVWGLDLWLDLELISCSHIVYLNLYNFLSQKFGLLEFKLCWI